MSKTNLREISDALPEAWRSKIIGRAAGATVKALRVDGGIPEESHGYAEGLLVMEGRMNLQVGGEMIPVASGEICIVPANTPHAVAAGSRDTLVTIDQDE